MTRNGANDFSGGENKLWHMIQGGDHEWMKDNVWQWMGHGWHFQNDPSWTYNDTDAMDW